MDIYTLGFKFRGVGRRCDPLRLMSYAFLYTTYVVKVYDYVESKIESKNLHENLHKNLHKNLHQNVNYSVKICVSYTNCGVFSVKIIKTWNHLDV